MGSSVAQVPAFKHLLLYTLFSANTISVTGSSLTLIAVPWFVLQTTGSATRVGFTGVAEVLAIIAAGFLGGVLVDRLGYKRTSVIADLASGAAIALIPLLYYSVGLAFWQLLILVFCAALFNAPGASARTALLPDIAGPAGMSLERANALLHAIERGSRLLGAPLAGILIALLGTSWVLWLDAASFVISALLIGLVIPRPRPTEGAQAMAKASGGYLAELGAGLRFIRHNRLVLAIVLTIIITNFLDSPLSAVVMPVYAKQRFGSPLALGLIEAAWGGGALVSALIYSALAPRLPRRATFIAAFILIGLPFWLLTSLPSLPFTLVAMAIIGAGSGPINPLLWTLSQERVPADMRGRVFGAIGAAAFAAMPLGLILAGYLVDAVGLHVTLLVIAACYLVVTLSTLFNRALREMDASVEKPDALESRET
ncbi:MAG: MFS transporter [Chloroflexota bacterium]|nr:MFS transporter [Chloroflexota bacterium]